MCDEYLAGRLDAVIRDGLTEVQLRHLVEDLADLARTLRRLAVPMGLCRRELCCGCLRLSPTTDPLGGLPSCDQR